MRSSKIRVHKLIRSRRRTIGLTITPEATLIVRAPLGAPRVFIDRFIHKQRGWIKRKLNEIKTRPKPVAHQFIEGEKFLYLGKTYPLRFAHVRSIRLDDSLTVPPSSPSHVRTALINWYKIQAKKVFTIRTDFYAKKMGVAHRAVKISDAATRWGSCGQSNSININWRLIMAPAAIVDYVIIHELAHIIHKNHSPLFWAEVARYFPRHKNARAWLGKIGHTLKF